VPCVITSGGLTSRVRWPYSSTRSEKARAGCFPPPYDLIHILLCYTRGRRPLGPPLGGLLLAPPCRDEPFCAVRRRRRHEPHGHAGSDCAAAAATDAPDARLATAATAIPVVDARGLYPSDAATLAGAAHKAACAPPAAATARCSSRAWRRRGRDVRRVLGAFAPLRRLPRHHRPARTARRRPRRALRRSLPPRVFFPPLPQLPSLRRCRHAAAPTQQATAGGKRGRWQPCNRPWSPPRARTTHRSRRAMALRRRRRHVFGRPQFPRRRVGLGRDTLPALRRFRRLPPRHWLPPPTATQFRTCAPTRGKRARAPKRAGGHRQPPPPVPSAHAGRVSRLPFRRRRRDSRARRERRCHPYPAAAGRSGRRRHATGATGHCIAAALAEASSRWGSHRPKRRKAARRRCSRPRRPSRPRGAGLDRLARPFTRLPGRSAPGSGGGRGRSGEAMRRRFAAADVGRLASADQWPRRRVAATLRRSAAFDRRQVILLPHTSTSVLSSTANH